MLAQFLVGFCLVFACLLACCSFLLATNDPDLFFFVIFCLSQLIGKWKVDEKVRNAAGIRSVISHLLFRSLCLSFPVFKLGTVTAFQWDALRFTSEKYLVWLISKHVVSDMQKETQKTKQKKTPCCLITGVLWMFFDIKKAAGSLQNNPKKV